MASVQALRFPRPRSTFSAWFERSSPGHIVMLGPKRQVIWTWTVWTVQRLFASHQPHWVHPTHPNSQPTTGQDRTQYMSGSSSGRLVNHSVKSPAFDKMARLRAPQSEQWSLNRPPFARPDSTTTSRYDLVSLTAYHQFTSRRHATRPSHSHPARPGHQSINQKQ